MLKILSNSFNEGTRQILKFVQKTTYLFIESYEIAQSEEYIQSDNPESWAINKP